MIHVSDMGKRKLAPHSAKHTKIVCRYCGPEGQEINRQSYKDHLRLKHADTSGDLREYGQKKLDIFGSIIRQGKEVPDSSSDKPSDVQPRLDEESGPSRRSRSRTVSPPPPAGRSGRISTVSNLAHI